jgi:two-component system, NtrC family, nitrogen regulation response regulator NtrX
MTTPTTRATARATLLLVEDEIGFRTSLRRTLEEAGYGTLEAGDGKIALDLLRTRPVDLVLLDLRLPRISGLEVLRRIADEHPGLAVIVLSSHGTIPSAVEATRLGALEFLEKDYDQEHTLQLVREVLERTAFPRLSRSSLEQAWERYGMIGASEPMQRVYRQIERAAPTEARVLIRGESGTGKEHVARAIHRNSPRAGAAFVAMNCARTDLEVMESELFGHVAGAFTGAIRDHKGCFERAHRGTLLLDEIGEMSLRAQAAVLRALETGRIRRLGGETAIPVDLRLIAATNQDLEDAREKGRFREDLYYRLEVIRIELPPLRERPEDLPALADHFLRSACEQHRLSPRRLAPAALYVLLEHDWPGNVRELDNVITRMAIDAPDTDLGAREAHAALRQRSAPPGPPPSITLEESRDAHDRRFLEQALCAHAYRIQETADEVGIHRVTLWNLIRRLGITVQPGGQAGAPPGD